MSEQNKNIKIVVDRSEELKQAQATIDQLNQKIGSQEELLKKYLVEDAEKERKKAEYAIDRKPAPMGDPTQTAPLEEHLVRNLDFENSEILDMMRFPSVEKVIETTELLANKGNPQAKSAMKILTRKALQKPLDMTFKGSIKDMVKSEVPIGEFDDEFTIKQKQAHNARLRENRVRWTQNRGD